MWTIITDSISVDPHNHYRKARNSIMWTSLKKSILTQWKSSKGPVNILTSLTCLFATDFNPHSARITSYNHGPKRKKHYRSTTIHDQASMGQPRPEDSSNWLNNQAGLKHGLALGFSRTRAQRASKSVRLARIKRFCSFPHDQFLIATFIIIIILLREKWDSHIWSFLRPSKT